MNNTDTHKITVLDVIYGNFINLDKQKKIEKAQSFIYIKCRWTNRKSDAKDRIFYGVSFPASTFSKVWVRVTCSPYEFRGKI